MDSTAFGLELDISETGANLTIVGHHTAMENKEGL